MAGRRSDEAGWRWPAAVAALVVAVLATAFVVTRGGDEGAEQTGPADEGPVATTPAEISGTVVVGDAVGGDLVPVARYGERRAAVWVYDATEDRVEALPPPPAGWFVDVTTVASDDWVVVAGEACPHRLVDEDSTGFACGPEGVDAVLAYDVAAGAWARLDVLREEEATTPRVTSIDGATATLSYAPTWRSPAVAFATVDLAADQLELVPRGDEPATQCGQAQSPPVWFTGVDATLAHVEAADGTEGRTVDLTVGGLLGPDLWRADPVPDCHSARDLLLLARHPTPTTPSTFTVYRLEDRPAEVVTVEGTADLTGLQLVAGPDWFATVEDGLVVVRDVDGGARTEVLSEEGEEPIATETGLVLVRVRGPAGVAFRVIPLP